MLTFIVDGYDPWDKVKALLNRINEEKPTDYEVILVSSYFAATGLEVCQEYGEGLFGTSFSILRNDDFCVYQARLQAQDRATGEKFIYLSPAIVPHSGAITALFRHLRDKGGICSGPLVFRYPGGRAERILAHGYVSDPEKRLAPVHAGADIASSAGGGNIHGILPQPYFFGSDGPFYRRCDRLASLWESHLAACARRQPALSIGKGAALMHPETFPLYARLSATLRYDGGPGIMDLPAQDSLVVSLNPFGRPIISDRIHTYTAGEEYGSEENIFWSLLQSQKPDMIAVASRSANPVLRGLARVALMEIAAKDWDRVRKLAEATLCGRQSGWQSFRQWLSLYEPLKHDLYANRKYSLKESVMLSGNLTAAMQNLGALLWRGLLGRSHCLL